ncbi:MAG: recombinase family protein [Clostridia bacterium]|nr:recombinase family protein [Clostridia bacterium]
MAKTVTKIPQTRNLFTTAPIATTARRKVAGYARVSTDSDEQFTSYEAQVDYYTRFIRSHADWDFVKVYTDEGISAVTTRHRDGFNEMVADALAGKIDLIITKSVSRFARNTVDSLTTIRKLKEHGCECFFEKENIYTFDGKGELLITIMSSLAQEESRSISENVTWGHRKRMADGKVTLAYSTFLGYDKGEDGNLVVNEKEARIVRLIYRKFMEGMAPIGICRMLDEMGILTPGGKTHWRESTILSILSNEKYKGDALLQKTFTVDFLTKKHKRNEGEVQQFYVSRNHEAIIPPEEFEQVQAELARRKRVGRAFSGNSVFASRLVCGDCGSYYGQKVWHSNDPYRKVIWRCNRKYGKGERCSTPTLSEDAIKALFVEAYNLLLGDRDSIIEDCETLANMLEDTMTLDTKIAATQEEIDTVVKLNKALIREHAVVGMPQEIFDQKAAAYDERFRKAEARLNRMKMEKEDRARRSTIVRQFIKALRGQAGPIDVWNEQAWCLLVTQAKVYAEGSVEFIFRGENSITVRAK